MLIRGLAVVIAVFWLCADSTMSQSDKLALVEVNRWEWGGLPVRDSVQALDMSGRYLVVSDRKTNRTYVFDKTGKVLWTKEPFDWWVDVAVDDNDSGLVLLTESYGECDYVQSVYDLSGISICNDCRIGGIPTVTPEFITNSVLELCAGRPAVLQRDGKLQKEVFGRDRPQSWGTTPINDSLLIYYTSDSIYLYDLSVSSIVSKKTIASGQIDFMSPFVGAASRTGTRYAYVTYESIVVNDRETGAEWMMSKDSSSLAGRPMYFQPEFLLLSPDGRFLISFRGLRKEAGVYVHRLDTGGVISDIGGIPLPRDSSRLHPYYAGHVVREHVAAVNLFAGKWKYKALIVPYREPAVIKKSVFIDGFVSGIRGGENPVITVFQPYVRDSDSCAVIEYEVRGHK